MNTDTTLWLTLSHAPGITNDTAHRLLQQSGSIANLFADLSALDGSGLTTAAKAFLRQQDSAALEADLRWAEQPGHCILTRDSEHWPRQLDNIPDAPLVLFVAGDPEYLSRPQLAIVGSRNPTEVGKRNATDFARYLADSGITITSGMALGIDGSAHRGALDGLAGTVALLAHGLDHLYPKQHRELAGAIAANGAIVSEMPIGTAAHAGLFPRRNRLISGLSLGTLVVEAAVRSGSLITARFALEQGREVFAIPGSIHNPLARGCHQLIRQGAKLVETAEDIVSELAGRFVVPEPQHDVDRSAENPNAGLDPDYQKLLKCLQFEPVSVDELVQRSGFKASEIASMLLILELEGNVVCDAGRYSRTC